jgi:hypothetical protein
VEQEIIIKNKTQAEPPAKIDLKDILLIVGFVSLEIGTAMFSHAGALVLGGVLLMAPSVVLPFFKRVK